MRKTGKDTTVTRQKKILAFILVIAFLFAVSSSFAFALGLVPAHKTVVISDSQSSYEVRILNEGGEAQNVELDVTGDFSDYISLSKYKIEFQKGQTQQDILVTINIPKSQSLKPGEYLARILLKENSEGGSGMMAVVGVASRIEMIVPGEGALLKTNLVAPNFKKDTQNYFSVDVNNLGGKEAVNCISVVEILTSLNVNIAVLTSEKKNIAPATTEKFLVSWTPNVGSGQYVAKASVICDNGDSGAERIFSIGSPELRILSFDSSDFRLGGISKFDLIVASDWSEEIKGVTADVQIMKDGKSLYTTTTESKNVAANGKVIFPVYLDTTGMSPGQYVVFVTLKYLDNEFEQAYNSYFAQDDFVLESLSGQVVGGDTSKRDEGGNSSNILLIVVIIFVLVINSVLVFKLIKRRNKGKE
ncbi:MAG: hypothetical protein ACP5N3_02925 [Candidatus Nanoarchaeia archaeon]